MTVNAVATVVRTVRAQIHLIGQIRQQPVGRPFDNIQGLPFLGITDSAVAEDAHVIAVGDAHKGRVALGLAAEQRYMASPSELGNCLAFTPLRLEVVERQRPRRILNEDRSLRARRRCEKLRRMVIVPPTAAGSGNKNRGMSQDGRAVLFASSKAENPQRVHVVGKKE